jgi:O-antigen ligase
MFTFLNLAVILVLNYSRGALISFVIGLALFSLLTRPLRKGLKEILLLFFISFLFFLFYYLFYPERIFEKGTLEARLCYLNIAWQIFKSSPIIGKGLGTFELLSDKVGSIHAMHVENIYVEILAQAGLLGLISYLLLFLKYFKILLKCCKLNINDNEAYLIGGAVLCFLVNGLFTSNIIVGISTSFLFWFLLGISVGENGKRLF